MAGAANCLTALLAPSRENDMTNEFLGFLLSLPDVGSDDTIHEHLAIGDEMARRAVLGVAAAQESRTVAVSVAGLQLH